MSTSKNDLEDSTSPTLASALPSPRRSTGSRAPTPPGAHLELTDFGIREGDEPPAQVDEKGRSPIKYGTREEWACLGALYCSMFLAGWNDATIGPLLLRMQSWYGLTYTIVSLVFVFNFVGFMLAALLNVYITTKFGFGVIICFGSSLQAFAYCLQCWAPPFPLFCVAQVFNGAGLGLQDAQANTFVAKLPGMMRKMSILHAVYGVGALVCPLVSTQFATLEHWSYHYLCSLGLALFTFSVLAYVFRFRSEESLLGKHQDDVSSSTASDDPAFHSPPPTLWEILKSPVVHLLAVWILIYVGAEVTIGGWIVTYIVEVRGGGPSAGYTSSGFFAGLTIGRIIFIPLTRRLGENLSIYVYTLAALALEMVVWFVPDLIGNAVAVSFVGVMIGPHYPIVMSAATKLLPRTHIGGAIGWIASFGQAGSAVFPFIVGAISQKHGLEALNPVVTAMLAALIVVWVATPRVPKKRD